MEKSSLNRGQILDSEEGADAVAWGITESKGPLKKLYIKHPELGPEDIRIKVLYSGICQSDVGLIYEKYYPGTFPIIPGHEIVGTIYEKGDEVKKLEIGDLVGVGPIRECCEECYYCGVGRTNLCEGVPMKMTAVPWFGGFATTVQIPHNYTFKIPEGIPAELAPPLMCAGGTVFAPLRKWGKFGGKAAILGMGGLGHLAVQYASKMGMKTFAVSTTDSKKDQILELGAHEFVVSTDPEQMKKFYTEKIDVMINTTGVGDVMTYMRALKKGSGVFVQVGGPEEEFKVSPAEILLNEWILAGSAAANRDDMQCMLDFSKTHDVTCINEYFKFEDFPKAFERIAKGKPNFRVVVDMQSK